MISTIKAFVELCVLTLLDQFQNVGQK